ncbi:uncharacterized protein LOC129719536 [Wyeomyia smithii]|uniref:uncharacterized protein LOC129719536 n=1 Tax=Wyeomyia smithii TaxID=174621 RepID=UPI0024681F12|nr:uncharacterized protein LOC129719536 [Wyeomyia smithii]
MTAPSYELSKFVGRIIQNSMDSAYNIKDSFEFCDFINTVTLPVGYSLISLDVVSLFTCIPKELVCHDVICYWDKIRPNAKNICLDLFLELVEFCIDASFLKFDGRYHQQVFGTAMGNPLSPIVAELVTKVLLDCVLKQLKIKVPFIKKYVDDLVTAIPLDQLDYVLKIFNSFNPNIQFTCETEKNNRLPFLDMLLVRHDDQHISTEWYQKPIASGRFLNYFSAHPPHQKINMAINFISRVNRLSTGLSESAKVNIMDQHLKLNDYPKTLRHRLINQRNCRSTEQHSSNQSPSEHLEYTYRSIAYIPYLTDKISKFLKNDYKTVELATRKTNMAKQYYTQTKDKIAKDDHTNVIYSISYNDCSSQYIGMTTNKLKTRISGHRSNLNALQKLVDNGTDIEDPQSATLSEKTALLHHCIRTQHTFDLNNVKILNQHRKHNSTTDFGNMPHSNEQQYS